MTDHSLIHYLSEIEDPRHRRGVRHSQLSSLLILVMGVLSGHTSLKGIARFSRAHADVLCQYISLPRHKPPSYSTLQRLSRQLNYDWVCESFNQWMSQYQTGETIAIDGKSITSTFKYTDEGKQSFASLVSFFSQHRQLIGAIGMLENDKCSEIEVVRSLISTLGVDKSVLTLDALHCQKKR